MKTNLMEGGAKEEDIVYACIPDEDDIDMPVGGITEKGVFKAHLDKKYNQLEIDPYSCFMFAVYQALSNFTGQDIPYSLMKYTFGRLKTDKKFTPGVGGKMIDGINYALEDYNLHFGDAIKAKVVPLTEGNIIESLKAKSPMITGIYYSKTYFADEQNDGDAWISDIGSIGKMGHLISIIKLNNTGYDTLVKFEENYVGVVKFDIIGVDFNLFRNLFFKTGAQLYR